MADLKAVARGVVSDNAGALVDLSHRIHANPELGFEERQSSQWVADALAAAGFAVDMGVADLPTAFVARHGSGSLHIGICAEYDALPGVGHACGHNIIAASAVGAAIALAAVASELDLTISVFGTPAEEGGGGKIYMLQRGAFDGIHAALMVHGAALERDAMATLAVATVEVEFIGKSAHAAAAPERGVNAAAAMTLAQVGIGVMREHMLETDRIHGIVRHGGDAPNVVPERTTGEWYIRSHSIDRMTELFGRTVNVFRGAALMTGCALRIRHTGPSFADMRTDVDMAHYWRTNAASLGRESLPLQAGDGYASTDMGNVSYAVPSIHPLLALESEGSNIHEAAFERLAAAPTGDAAVIDGATAMAWTVIDIAGNASLRQRLTAKPFFVNDVPADAPWLGRDTDTVIKYDPSFDPQSRV
jgi:amidohydrolase